MSHDIIIEKLSMDPSGYIMGLGHQYKLNLEYYKVQMLNAQEIRSKTTVSLTMGQRDPLGFAQKLRAMAIAIEHAVEHG